VLGYRGGVYLSKPRVLGHRGGGVALARRDAAAAVLTLPLRGLFILVSKLAQVVRKLKGQKALPPMK
jgi:hypothetical protein